MEIRRADFREGRGPDAALRNPVCLLSAMDEGTEARSDIVFCITIH